MTWSWNKLSAAKWEDAWSERIAGNPNAVITKIKGENGSNHRLLR